MHNTHLSGEMLFNTIKISPITPRCIVRLPAEGDEVCSFAEEAPRCSKGSHRILGQRGDIQSLRLQSTFVKVNDQQFRHVVYRIFVHDMNAKDVRARRFKKIETLLR